MPGAIPAIDVVAIRAAAGALAPLGPAVGDGGNRTIGAWRQLGAYYIAPETPVLLAALDPVGPLTQRAADRVSGLARALTGFADRVEPLLAELRRLAGPATATRENALLAELAVAEQECAAAIRALAAFDPRPPSVRVSEQVDKAGVAITVGFVTIGRSAVFKETRFSDGSVLLTAVDAGELGATGSLGGVLDFGAGVTIENGSTWRFRTPEEAAALRQQLDAYVAQQRAVLFDDSGGAAAGVAIFGGVPVPRPPDLVVTELGVPLTAEGSVDAGLAGGSIGAGGTVKETLVRDVATGATTTVSSREGSVTAGVTGTPFGVGPSVGAGGTLLAGSTTAVTRDAAGRVTRVLLTSTDSTQGAVSDNLTGPGEEPPGGRHRAPGLDPSGTIVDEHKDTSVTVTTTTLDVTDANRAAVETWVTGGAHDGDGAVGDPALHFPAAAVPGDPFQNALHDGARVTQVTYDEATDAAGVDAKVKAGWELGFEVTGEETTTHAGAGSYLDVPGPDGVRRRLPLPAR
jgi:hypothetical protein